MEERAVVQSCAMYLPLNSVVTVLEAKADAAGVCALPESQHAAA